MKKQLLLFAMILLPLVASAHDIEVKNADGVTIYYNYINDGAELEVTYRGNDYSKFGGNYADNVVIPEEVTYMNRIRKVTSIGDYAFYFCNYLTSITIPNSVTNIGNSAFYSCTSLTKVIVSDIAAWCGIIFYSPDVNPLYYAHHLYSDEKTEIKDLIISDNVTNIGNYAFCGCSGLSSVTIPNSVTSIGAGAFVSCAGLTSITIPNSVTSIGAAAFSGCAGLTSVTIGSGLSSLGRNTLSRLGVPTWPFSQCDKLTTIVVDSENIKYDSRNNCNAIIETSSNQLIFGCQNTIIPYSVTSIGAGAFYSCTGLTSITIPNSVTSFGAGAFYSCAGLTSITIPNSVTSIGNFAFYSCTGLTSITIPNSVTSIGESAFGGVDISTVISLIENPFRITGNTYHSTFSLNTFNNATLYVPKGTIDKYKATDGWKDFVFIEEGTGGSVTPPPPPTPEKCEKPTIGYSNEKLTFTSSTEGATCYYSITDSDIRAGSGSEVQLGVTYNISVYATKSGYYNSDVATATLCWIDASPKTEGITDGVAQIAARPVLVKTDNGFITVEGADDRTNVSVYTTDGKQVGSAISLNNIATIATSIQPGSIAIVKVGDKAVKVVIK